jgi:hypothetical protein
MRSVLEQLKTVHTTNAANKVANFLYDLPVASGF